MIDRKVLNNELEPYFGELTKYVVPIKYEMLTPDLFGLFFQAPEKKSKQYKYFVLLNFDYLASLTEGRNIIEKWQGKVLRFINRPKSTKNIQSPLIAEVEKPKGNGYWAKVFAIMPGDDIGKKIAHLSKVQQQKIREQLAQIFRPRADASKTFAESFIYSTQTAIKKDVNTSDLGVWIYAQDDNHIEFFTNYVR